MIVTNPTHWILCFATDGIGYLGPNLSESVKMMLVNVTTNALHMAELERMLGALGLSAMVVYMAPDSLTLLTLAFFMATSSYYPQALVDYFSTTWSANNNKDQFEPELPEPVLQALKSARRLGRRVFTLG